MKFSTLLTRYRRDFAYWLASLSVLIASADVALGAAGIHSWERPPLVYRLWLLQLLTTKLSCFVLKDGLVECPDAFNRSAVVDAFTQFVINLEIEPDKLQMMSSAALSSVDVYGTARVSSAMVGISSPLSLRPASSSDVGLGFGGSMIQTSVVRAYRQA